MNWLAGDVLGQFIIRALENGEDSDQDNSFRWKFLTQQFEDPRILECRDLNVFPIFDEHYNPENEDIVSVMVMQRKERMEDNMGGMMRGLTRVVQSVFTLGFSNLQYFTKWKYTEENFVFRIDTKTKKVYCRCNQIEQEVQSISIKTNNYLTDDEEYLSVEFAGGSGSFFTKNTFDLANNMAKNRRISEVFEGQKKLYNLLLRTNFKKDLADTNAEDGAEADDKFGKLRDFLVVVDDHGERRRRLAQRPIHRLMNAIEEHSN